MNKKYIVLIMIGVLSVDGSTLIAGDGNGLSTLLGKGITSFQGGMNNLLKLSTAATTAAVGAAAVGGQVAGSVAGQAMGAAAQAQQNVALARQNALNGLAAGVAAVNQPVGNVAPQPSVAANQPAGQNGQQIAPSAGTDNDPDDDDSNAEAAAENQSLATAQAAAAADDTQVAAATDAGDMKDDLDAAAQAADALGVKLPDGYTVPVDAAPVDDTADSATPGESSGTAAPAAA